MPVDSAFESRSFNLTRAPGLNSGVPPPRMIGFTAMRNSSISPCSVKSAARSALPNKKMSLALSRFNLATVSGTSAPNICVLAHADCLSVRENTYFGNAFMKSATSPVAVGQWFAISS